MNIADFSLTFLLILPGFLLLHLVFLVSRIRRLTAFYATTWSLFISLILFVLAYLPYTAIADSPTDSASWPTLKAALASPTTIPNDVWVSLYLGAVVLGLAIGHLDRKGIPERCLLILGIDLRRHGDVWGRLFREQPSRYILVYLRSGGIFGGWPLHVSDDRSEPGPELYLSPAYTWDTLNTKWRSLQEIDGILIHGSEISRVEFLPEESN